MVLKLIDLKFRNKKSKNCRFFEKSFQKDCLNSKPKRPTRLSATQTFKQCPF